MGIVILLVSIVHTLFRIIGQLKKNKLRKMSSGKMHTGKMHKELCPFRYCMAMLSNCTVACTGKVVTHLIDIY